MAVVKLILDVKDAAYIAANPTKVLDLDEPIYRDDGFVAFGDNVTQLQNLVFKPLFSSTTWGGIGGTLSNQTDLQSALDAKVSISSLLTPTPYTGTTNLYSIAIGAVSENFTCVANSIKGNPYFVEKSDVIDSVQIRMASPSAAGGLGQIAIYRAGSNNLPAARLWSSSSFAIDVTATISVTGIGLSITPGLYFVLFNSSVSSGLIRTTSTCIALLGFNVSGASPVPYNGISYSAQTFGTWPADLSATTLGGYVSGTGAPMIFIGFS